MSSMMILLTIWGVLTGILVLLLIYRSTVSMHEEDQLFLDESEDHMAREQAEIVRKLERITPLVRVLGVACGLLILGIAALWIYQGLTQTP